NTSTGMLTLNGDPRIINDNITLDRGLFSTVQVRIDDVINFLAAASVKSVEIDAAAGNDIINIVSTLGVPVGANGQDGDDTFNVGSEADRLNLIRNLTLDGGLGQNTLNFMDQGAPNNQAYVLTDDELRIPTDQGLAASFQDIQILTLYGGPLQN